MKFFGALIGNPVDGALLGKTFPWTKPITFRGVDFLSVFWLEELYTHASIGGNNNRRYWIYYHSSDSCSPERYTNYLTILCDCVFAHAYTYIHAFQNGILTRKNDVDEGFERKPEGYSNISAVGRKSIVSMAISEQIELCRVSRVIP